ncbi:TonB-dependent receptor [Aquamicrobium sp. LC103]|uniref:TonB-dependent receptor domain-containing protein n=1 Tax=Aquamicrobium sp. LC103 TaxID=1120658 RepID=UPI00069B6693|nr:TonB-dependent receptor [Aquamicrobium sp. LC103]TKT74895.1 TonB-dependent receptor [Aquamicrobium sp. LC103]
MNRTGILARLRPALLLGVAFYLALPHSQVLAQQRTGETGSGQTEETGQTADGTLLDPVLVTARKGGTKDEAFKTPAAVTSVDAVDIERFGQKSAGDVLRTIPGVFTEASARSPALAINIRGMQDFGRNAVTIDGARQNLQVSGHGSNGWVFVDPNLLAGVDVERGIVSTAQGSGVIGGAVNFRTIGLDDVVAPDRQWGILTKGSYGDNGYGYSGMTAAGYRFGENAGVVGAISGRDASDYTDGWDQTVQWTGQKPRSGLFKVNLAPGVDQKLDFGAVIYGNDWEVGNTPTQAGTRMETDVKTFTTAYSYAPADNDLIDLRINAYFNDTRFHQWFPQSHISRNTHVEYKDKGAGGSISNTSRFDLGAASLAVEYGGEYYFDEVDAEASSTVPGGVPDPAYSGLTPSGERGIGGVFSKSALTWGMVDLIGAVRYDAYRLTGSGNNPFEDGLIPVGPFNVDKSEGKLTGKGTLAVTPIDGLQLYASYGSGFRPPAITETLMASTHPGGMAFLKFRPNPFLKPETSTGWEIGANLSYDSVFVDGDSLRVKGSYYDNEVENYITSAWSTVGGLNFTYVNMPTPSRLKGFELSADYDLGFAFAGLAYQDTDIRLVPPAPTFGMTLTPPEKVWTASAGIRLFEEKLTLGGRVRFVSESERFNVMGAITPVPEYKLYDVFASYQATENFNAYVTIENITNEGYIIAKEYEAREGPGRTIMGGFTARF